MTKTILIALVICSSTAFGAGNIVSLALDEGVGSTVSDASGSGNHGTIRDGATWTTGKVGQALQFNGSQALQIADSASLDFATMSVAVWVKKSSSAQGGYNQIVSRQAGTGNADLWLLFYDQNNTDDIRFCLLNACTTSLPTTADVNTWVHYAGTFDGSALRLYRNGVQVSSGAASGSLASDNSHICIASGANDGSRNCTSEFFFGAVDELHIYDRALSQSEVQQLYVGAPPVPDITAPSQPLQFGGSSNSTSQITLSWAASTDNVGVTGYQLYRNGAPLPTTTNTNYQDTGLAIGTTYSYAVAAFDAAGNFSTPSTTISVATLSAPPPPPPLDQNLVLYLSLNEGSGTTASDASGNSNNATLFNGVAWGAGQNGGGLSLDGVNDYFTVPDSNSLDVGDSFTFALWIKRGRVNHSGYEILFSKGSQTSVLLIQPDNTVWLCGWGIGCPVVTTAKITDTTSFHHLAITKSGSTARIYIDGTLSSSVSNAYPFGNSSLKMAFGVDVDGNGNPSGGLFKGIVDEIRIYNRPLTATEVQQVFSDTVVPPPPPPPPPPPTNTPPTVTITQPLLTGTITVTADAFDNVSVAGVQFKLDGVNVGTEDTSAPYSITLNTAAYSNGNHTLTAVARDVPGLSTTSDAVALAFRNTPPAGFGKVLPLGDSIVYGWTGDANSEDGGFRRFLWETLAANGMTANTNFVGPTQTGIAGIDRDHDGHNGWRTDQIQGLVAPDFNAYDPALVIVDGGANDLNQGRTVTQALNGLSSLLTAIFAAKPNVKVLLLNYFIPRVNNDYPLIASQIPNFNAGIPSIVSGLLASGRNIELVDLTTAGLSSASNSTDFAADGLHPSSAGYSKIAALIYSALTN